MYILEMLRKQIEGSNVLVITAPIPLPFYSMISAVIYFGDLNRGVFDWLSFISQREPFANLISFANVSRFIVIFNYSPNQTRKKLANPKNKWINTKSLLNKNETKQNWKEKKIRVETYIHLFLRVFFGCTLLMNLANLFNTTGLFFSTSQTHRRTLT